MVKDSYEDYKNWERKENSRWGKISKQVKPVHVIGILLLFFMGNSWVGSGKIDSNLFWGFAISFGALMLFLYFRETNEKKLIPEHIIKEIAYDALEKKRRKGIELPFDCKIKVDLLGEGIYEQDFISGTSGIIRRDVGFKIIRKGYKKTGVVSIHPYNGTILGIREEKLGYSGKSTPHRIIIPVGFLDKKD